MKRINKFLMISLLSFTLSSCNGNAKVFNPESSKIVSVESITTRKNK